MRKRMRNKIRFVIALGIAVVALYGFGIYGAQRGLFWTVGLTFEEDGIGGIVSGPNGPEAGVSVFAESRDLPAKVVATAVTDDQGRYVLSGLPKAVYDVWVLGGGLEASPKVQSVPGQMLNLTAVPAPHAADQ